MAVDSMPVTDQQARALAFLAAAARPSGARRWDEPGIVAAIAKVKHLHLADVALAAMRAADDRTLETPGAIGNPASSCWRERNADRPRASVRSAGPWCKSCGDTKDEHSAGDHKFEERVEAAVDTAHLPEDLATELAKTRAVLRGGAA